MGCCDTEHWNTVFDVRIVSDFDEGFEAQGAAYFLGKQSRGVCFHHAESISAGHELTFLE